MISMVIGIVLVLVGFGYAMIVSPILMLVLIMGFSDDPTVTLKRYSKLHASVIFVTLIVAILMPPISFVGFGIWLIFWG